MAPAQLAGGRGAVHVGTAIAVVVHPAVVGLGRRARAPFPDVPETDGRVGAGHGRSLGLAVQRAGQAGDGGFAPVDPLQVDHHQHLLGHGQPVEVGGQEQGADALLGPAVIDELKGEAQVGKDDAHLGFYRVDGGLGPGQPVGRIGVQRRQRLGGGGGGAALALALQVVYGDAVAQAHVPATPDLFGAQHHGGRCRGSLRMRLAVEGHPEKILEVTGQWQLAGVDRARGGPTRHRDRGHAGGQLVGADGKALVLGGKAGQVGQVGVGGEHPETFRRACRSRRCCPGR
jgi:hypothetical protein